MAEVYHDPASHYDRVTTAWGLLLGEDLHYGLFDGGDEALPDATQALTSLMAVAAQPLEGTDLLDVGCGTGSPACFLASLGARVTGITTSAVGVASAIERAASHDLSDRVSFVLSDGTENNFPDDSFDRVWVMESSHLMRDREALMSECARVLRPGGRLVLCDIVLRRPMPFEEVRRLRKELVLLREVFGEARMEELGRYREMAEAYGLNVVETVDLTSATRPTFDRWQQNAADHHVVVVEELGEADWQRFVDSCDVLRSFWDDGTLGYGLLAAEKP